jgi:hypothetical protein
LQSPMAEKWAQKIPNLKALLPKVLPKYSTGGGT